MRLFFLYLTLVVSANLHSADLNLLTNEQQQQLVLDDTIRGELRLFNDLLLEGYEYIDGQGKTEEKISSLISNFLNEEISIDELWIALDPIKKNAFKTSEIFEEKVSKINYRSLSDKKFFLPLYTFNYEEITKVNSYLRNTARIIVNQIDSLEAGDVDKYDYFIARSGLLNTDFLLIMANSRDLATSITPRSSIYHYIYKIDASTFRVSAFATKVNSLYILGELNEKKLKDLEIKVKDSYRKQTNLKLKKDLDNILNNLLNLFSQMATPDELDIFKELKEDVEMYYDSASRLSEDYLSLVELFTKNNVNLTYSIDSTIQGKEFDYINEKILFDKEQSTQFGESINKNIILVQNILLKYVN
jgi:hypothetical protein|tara:strand:+ start:236 stop:1315 length:1080 start_codon:yes stop_codon:yes gene_type:complete